MINESSHQQPRGAYKPWFDVTVLIIAHIVLLPVWLVLWTSIPILIWLGDRGPIFYKQARVGKGGKVFTVFKFRTMVPNADEKGAAWTTDKDPRITRVGRLLRKTALDELPEIINIWKQDMSLVGPRALDVSEQHSLETMIAGFEERLEVRPGLTGLAQIYEPYDNPHRKLHYDLQYIERMSMPLDIKLLILSLRNTLGIKWDNRMEKQGIVKSLGGPESLSQKNEDPQDQ